jgi:hypothetical protein
VSVIRRIVSFRSIKCPYLLIERVGQSVALASLMRLPVILPVALLLALTGIANAQPGMAPPGQTAPYQQQQYAQPYVQYPQQLPTRTVSYGTHVFLTDLASWAVLGASADSELGEVAVAGMFLGGPIVHLAHGNNSGAVYSLLARTGLPFGGALLFSSGCDDDYDCFGGIIAGAMLGYAGALAIDWFHLAKKTEVVAMPTGWASLRPSLSVTRNGGQAGLGMSF